MPTVLQLVLSLNPGGTERLVLEIVKRLHSQVPMMVCCLDEKGAWASELESLGVPVHELRRAAGFRPSLGRQVARIAHRHRAGIVHCHHYSPFVYGCVAKLWRPGLRLIFTEHGRLSDAKPSGKRRLANSVLARVPSAVFAVSGDLRRHLMDEGFGPSRVGVIYNGIEPGLVPGAAARADVRRRLGVEDDSTFVVGTIARLDPVKDLATLVRAVATFRRRQPVVLAIIGDGAERSSLESLARDVGVTEVTHFLGARNDARDWLPGCDAYVNCSTSEGVSLTILEAMAAARPVIATRVGGTPEVVSEGCGRLIPARDPDALARTLMELAESPDLRARLGGAARKRVEERFSLDRMVREYLEVYREARPGGRHFEQ